MLRLIYSQCIFSLKLCLLVCYQAQVKFERRVRVCQSFNEVDVTLNSKLKIYWLCHYIGSLCATSYVLDEFR